MPMEIRDTDNGLGNIITGRDRIKDKEYVDAILKHLSQDEDKFKRYRYSLSDYTEVTNLEISSKSVELVAKYCQKASTVNSEAVVAIVAKKDVVYGLARMWEMLSDNTKWDIKVFRSREEAEAWISEKVDMKYGIKNITFN
jgi:hypothetical protein